MNHDFYNGWQVGLSGEKPTTEITQAWLEGYALATLPHGIRWDFATYLAEILRVAKTAGGVREAALCIEAFADAAEDGTKRYFANNVSMALAPGIGPGDDPLRQWIVAVVEHV